MNKEEDILLIVPNYFKNDTIKKISSLNKLEPIKVLTEKEFINNLFFSFNERAIVYLCRKYNMKYDTAIMYMNNMYYVDDVVSDNLKIKKLKELKEELENKQLIKQNKLFIESIKSKRIVYYGFKHINKFNLKTIDKLKKITHVEIEKNDKPNEYIHNIYEFNDINQEVQFVATNICELISNQISIEKIVILNDSDEYINILKRDFNFYKIPCNYPESNTIYGTNICNYFISMINTDISKTLSSVREKFDMNNDFVLDIYDQIVNICNKYSFVDDYTLIKEIIIEELKQTKIKSRIIKNGIRIESINEYVPDDDDYVFLIGFNQELVPKFLKDEEYLTDNLREKLDLETTIEKNIINKENSINLIKSIKNLWLTYKKNDKFGKCEISFLNDDLKYKIIKSNTISYNYSNLSNLIRLAEGLDTYLKYGETNSDIINIYNNYKNINYRTYKNEYKKISVNDQDLVLSYSSLDAYYKCAFSYYINYVLKLNIYDNNFFSYIGSLYHYVLSKKDDQPMETSWNEYIQKNQREFNNKEEYFLEKLKSQLADIINIINYQEEKIGFKNKVHEQKIELLNGNVKVIGIIDKILFNNDNTMAAIVDYKTGNPKINLDYLNFGLGMQLPMYLYLLVNQYKNIDVVGIYLQKIIPSLIKCDYIKSIEDQKRDLLKLQGYTLSNEEKLVQFDSNYYDSDIIKNMKCGNNGFNYYAKTISDEKIKEIINIVNDKIIEAGKNIVDNNFPINPKEIEGKNVGCEYCKFKDICFMTKKDIVKISRKEVGGDTNDKMD